MFRNFFICLFLLLIMTSVTLTAQLPFNEELLKPFVYRSLGPYRAGSWVTAFAVPSFPQKAHLYTFYVGTRNGGLWKTTNNGVTFVPLFDNQEMLSIGALALSPSDPDIVWVGTGESYCARSSNRGDGVYKSLDGGKSWKNMGLRDSHHISKIIIHPTNPDIVYVAAMGRLFSPNDERGVFKSEDGGKTWKKVLYIDDNTGAIDLLAHPKNPDILFAAMYEKYRYPWHFEEGGPNSGVFKSSDGGNKWNRVSGGLPQGSLGRIGLDIYLKNPNILYAVIENVNKRPPTEDEAKADHAKNITPAPRFIGNEIYRSDDCGVNWKKMNSSKDDVGGKAPYSFNQIFVDPNNDLNLFVLSDSLPNSIDGGKTWFDLVWGDFRLFKSMFGDVRTLWIDPQNSDRILLGSDGGVHISYDGGKTCDHFTNLPLGEFYAIGVDMEDPYNIYGGLQDHDSWKGPSNGKMGQIGIEDWEIVGDGDGMYNQVDPSDSRWVYNGREFGSFYRLDQTLGARVAITPQRKEGQIPLRFNWTPPLLLSPHNSRILYTGAQVVFRSLDQGNHWQEISPDLTGNDPKKTNGRGHIKFCTITSISESPVQPGVIWVGTDDGKVWVTKNGGGSWDELTKNLTSAGAPEDYWVTRVFASNHQPGTAYVSKTGFQRDISKPYLYKTTDFGATWAAIITGLPNSNINVVIEDRKNPSLLFCGADCGVFVSIDSGGHWVRFKNNMPSVQVRDMLIHPRENDLIVGTYGRGLYMTNIAPLQELTGEVLKKDSHVFAIVHKPPRVNRNFGNYNLYGDRQIVTPNEPEGLVVTYYLKEKAKGKIRVIVTDSCGKEVAAFDGTGNAGINKGIASPGVLIPSSPLTARLVVVQEKSKKGIASPGVKGKL